MPPVSKAEATKLVARLDTDLTHGATTAQRLQEIVGQGAKRSLIEQIDAVLSWFTPPVDLNSFSPGPCVEMPSGVRYTGLSSGGPSSPDYAYIQFRYTVGDDGTIRRNKFHLHKIILLLTDEAEFADALRHPRYEVYLSRTIEPRPLTSARTTCAVIHCT